jgi:hypothetical protein
MAQLSIGTIIARCASTFRMDKLRFSRFTRIMFGLAFACLTSGCFTGRLTEHSKVCTRTYFIPSAVYEATNSTRMGLEGRLIIEKSYYSPGTEVGHSYLILAEPVSISKDGQAWLSSLDQTYPKGIKAMVTNGLPQSFAKVTDFNNAFSRGVFVAGTERHPNKGWWALSPVTVSLDIATFPFQAILGVLWVLNAKC